MMILVMQQPVAVTMNMPACLRAYSEGVLTETDCGCSNNDYINSVIEQSAVIVGYSINPYTMGCQGYWIVKNSWGENWGEDGYIRLCISSVDDNMNLGMCNILAYPQIPQVGIFSFE